MHSSLAETEETMKSLLLSAVFGLATLGLFLGTTDEAQAQRGRRGGDGWGRGYYGGGYYGGGYYGRGWRSGYYGGYYPGYYSSSYYYPDTTTQSYYYSPDSTGRYS